MNKSFLKTHCTLFKTYFWKRENKWCFSTKGIIVSFEDVLLNPIAEQVSLVENVRALPYKSEEQGELKLQVWGITPSSIQVGGRGEKYHTLHTGYISFDIDNLGDTLLTAFEKIKLIPFIFYCGRSVSGSGLWGLMKVSNPEKHQEHFDAISAAFAAMGIVIDTTPRNVASLRFICYDPEAYLNENALTFNKIIEPVIPIKKASRKYTGPRSISDQNIWTKFNDTVEFDDINDILQNAGWSRHPSKKSARVRYTRPGKSTRAGISADYHTERRTFFIFSSNAPGLEHFKKEGDKCYSGSASTLLLAYAAKGDKKEAYKKMKELGF
ncbi:MAG TPA: BT4734/BF3469 family protein [Pedobacter sp.]|jgi:hypothetical protein